MWLATKDLVSALSFLRYSTALGMERFRLCIAEQPVGSGGDITSASHRAGFHAADFRENNREQRDHRERTRRLGVCSQRSHLFKTLVTINSKAERHRCHYK